MTLGIAPEPLRGTTSTQDGTGLRRTVIVLEVLSNDADRVEGETIDSMDLSRLSDEATSGSVSLVAHTIVDAEVPSDVMRTLLQEQGSDPDFLDGAADWVPDEVA